MTGAPVDLGQPLPLDRTPVKQDEESYALERTLVALINVGSAQQERSMQSALGMSEAGTSCDRQLAFKLAGYPTVNPTDILRSLVGTGTHSVLADMFFRLGGRGTSGRWDVERKVEYGGLRGTVDLYDRGNGTVVDWKTTLAAKVNRIRLDGPPGQSVTQVQLYGAALWADGEDVRYVSLAYLPVDGKLTDMSLWRTRLDRAVADRAIARVDRIRGDGRAPHETPKNPSALCGWCPYYLPLGSGINSCTGKEQNGENNATATGSL